MGGKRGLPCQLYLRCNALNTKVTLELRLVRVLYYFVFQTCLMYKCKTFIRSFIRKFHSCYYEYAWLSIMTSFRPAFFYHQTKISRGQVLY